MCKACQALNVNGVLCHEQGCPESWQDETRECLYCGTAFTPETPWQDYCDESCMSSYNGADIDEVD